MPANRFYVPEITDCVHLPRDEYRHLTTVMRAKPGDVVELVDGRGTLAHATFTEKGLEVTESHHEPAPRPLVLLQALPKTAKLELIVEKGTELGVTTFHLFPGARSDSKALSENKLARLRHIVIAALKQSGRLYLPEIILSHTIPSVDIPLYYGDPDATQSIDAPLPCAIAIGPESGFTEKEKKQLGTPVRLHHNTLRCETAAITALAQVWKP